MAVASQSLLLEPAEPERLAHLCGPEDANLRQIEQGLGVAIHNRGNRFQLHGPDAAVSAAFTVLRELYDASRSGPVTPERVHIGVRSAARDVSVDDDDPDAPSADEPVIKTRRGLIRGRGPNQRRYLKSLAEFDLNFGVGPAGTGKTYLAVASAVAALEADRVRRLLLVRPAVEAGERLGFLPGDLAQKIDPYLRPLYDALYEMLGFERVARLIERNVIEIAPLAYMRGRTLNESFIILDEAQNTTVEQMKMFLTRFGYGSTVVVNGDTSQIDLPRHQKSGLRHALEVLDGVGDISITRFTSQDVIRHPLVQRIVEAYQRHEDAAES
ncbi:MULTISPECIES: PhoH family protein [Spectribacter]|uniref:PhoH-like protein n=2 Tax=Spectribacter TaxID=3160928 RepID=A0ABU3C3E0_9GAMM|nr:MULTISPECIES: PhoH family protein [unclassified Salinisphaera]MDT0617624.1 PhoH family protein [Salinisphaera sp. P385]MDT0636077.1 PhoH family protein [Salinisphaera sp. W335]